MERGRDVHPPQKKIKLKPAPDPYQTTHTQGAWQSDGAKIISGVNPIKLFQCKLVKNGFKG